MGYKGGEKKDQLRGIFQDHWKGSSDGGAFCGKAGGCRLSKNRSRCHPSSRSDTSLELFPLFFRDTKNPEGGTGRSSPSHFCARFGREPGRFSADGEIPLAQGTGAKLSGEIQTRPDDRSDGGRLGSVYPAGPEGDRRKKSGDCCPQPGRSYRASGGRRTPFAEIGQDADYLGDASPRNASGSIYQFKGHSTDKARKRVDPKTEPEKMAQVGAWRDLLEPK